MASSECADRTRALRVLRVLTRPNLGGPTRQAIALWHAHNKLGIETLLVTGVVGPGESFLSPAEHGVPQVTSAGASGGWVEVPELHPGIDPFGDWRVRRSLRRLLRAFAPDVVHTHTSKAGLLGRRAALAERVPVVAHTFHGHVLRDYFGRFASRLLARVERRLARRTDLLFAISGSCADELAALGIAARERFAVLPPAVPLAAPLPRSEARRALGIGPDEWRVAAIGRLVPIKRFAHFVELVARVSGLGGDLIGDGPERGVLTELAERRAPGRVRLCGSDPDIAAKLAAYDAVVVPSVREGCPLVAIEAFSAGVPVVGYDVPGVRDVLGDLGRGVLVDARDGCAGLARAVAALRADAAGRARLVAAAEQALARCRPDQVARQLAGAYRAAVQNARPGYHGARPG